jgi:ammonium transporter, Amt family
MSPRFVILFYESGSMKPFRIASFWPYIGTAFFMLLTSAGVYAAPTPAKADTAWMMVSTLLVMLMAIPGLALFYGGLVRSKNMLSVLMQVMVIFMMITIAWVAYGYSLAFTGSSPYIGGLSKLFLAGITPDSLAATFSKGVVIPELIFVAFQATFAAITACLIIGSFAERARFSAVLLFSLLWFTFSYLPIAHMVWYWDGPDAIHDTASLATVTKQAGWLWAKGALDFAGGTVVHINSGIAGLVCAYCIGKRVGYRNSQMSPAGMAPHSLTLTMVGASLLCVGWFGFNAGSSLEANGTAALAFINTFLGAAAGTLAWTFGEWLLKGKPSMLGAASGAVAGLVGITPGCGFVGPMGAITIGAFTGLACIFGVTRLKRFLEVDDALDVFGVHGLGGIVGALLTGVFTAPALGGTGIYDYVKNATDPSYSVINQLLVQGEGVLITLLWSGIVSFVVYKIVDTLIGFRVSEEDEREGLDTATHGEAAYH